MPRVLTGLLIIGTHPGELRHVQVARENSTTVGMKPGFETAGASGRGFGCPVSGAFARFRGGFGCPVSAALGRFQAGSPIETGQKAGFKLRSFAMRAAAERER